jgi:acyl carrier protein
MGLDSVELVLDIEDAFQIALSDEEAEKSLTPGILTDIVFSKVNKAGRDLSCQSQSAFYRIRKILVDEFGFRRSLISPTTPLKVLIPLKQRLSVWKVLQAQLPVNTTFSSTPFTFPSQFLTVGDLVKACGISKTSKTWSREEVFLKIRKITSENLGINESEILETSLFVRDLGID